MRVIVFLIILSSFLSFNALKTSENEEVLYVEKAIGTINFKFQEDLLQFVRTANAFSFELEKFETLHSEETIKKSYRTLRSDFKKVEFIIEYLDKEASDKLLNGAPLPKLEQKVTEHVILEPKGLQVIDELMGADDISLVITDLKIMAGKFEKDASHIQKYLASKKITDRQFFEASRQSLIRLAALGITGFDTPGTTEGINDTPIVLQTLRKYLQLYTYEISNIKKSELLAEADTILKKGIRQAQQENFEIFNRLTFIRNTINPLYHKILDIHTSLGYETIEEVTRYKPAVNYSSTNIFSPDFLNTSYYASIPTDSTFINKAALGRLLFYDPILSNDNSLSCASCHDPEKAFTDGRATSLSNTGKNLLRNAMTLNYATYASGYFHDMRTKRIEDQFEHVIVSKDEFDTNYQHIIKKLEGSTTYKSHFKKAFPNQKRTIVSNNIDYALVAYVMKLNSFDSEVDLYMQGVTEMLPENVKRGFNLFTGKAACATCHFMPLFSGTVPPLYVESESEVLGVPDHKDTPLILDEDIGRLGNGLTQEVAPFFKNAFKTPTIRNIAKTAPYMHNGVYNSLQEVMQFYNEGGGAGRGLDIEHQTLAPDPLDLSEDEMADIIAFMNALTDTKVFTAPDNLPRDFPVKQWNERVFSQ